MSQDHCNGPETYEADMQLFNQKLVVWENLWRAILNFKIVERTANSMSSEADCVNCIEVVNVVDEGIFHLCNSGWTGEPF